MAQLLTNKPTDDELSLEGAWSHHVTHFKFLVPLTYLGRLKLETSNFLHCLAI